MTTTKEKIEKLQAQIAKSKDKLTKHKKDKVDKYYKLCKELGIRNPDKWDAYSEGRSSEQFYAKCYYDHAKFGYEIMQSKLDDMNKRLKALYEKKQKEDLKNNTTPQIPVIEEFLENWKKSAREYYLQQVEALEKFDAEYSNNLDEVLKELEIKYGKPAVLKMSADVKKELKDRKVDYTSRNMYIKTHFNSVTVELSQLGSEMNERLESLLSSEVNKKRADFYARCYNVVGDITDASSLHVGKNGSINGTIVGKLGKAVVETIMAGGYNVQVLHYRVLVTPLNKKSTKIKGSSKGGNNSKYSDKTLSELREMAENLGLKFNYDRYKNNNILRMHLVMALKKTK
jgi:hypothetical protein